MINPWKPALPLIFRIQVCAGFQGAAFNHRLICK